MRKELLAWPVQNVWWKVEGFQRFVLTGDVIQEALSKLKELDQNPGGEGDGGGSQCKPPSTAKMHNTERYLL